MQDFEDRLKRKALLPGTCDKYRAIVDATHHEDPIAWLRSKIHARTPLGTVLPLRAAISHYLIAEHGYSEEDLKELLPKARGRAAARRDALSPQALALYHAAVADMVPEPCRTILDLLPSTGLRISEMCGLHRSHVEQPGPNELELVFRGKGDKQRVVPMTTSGSTKLLAYFREMQPKDWLFPGRGGAPITPHAVRIYTRKMRVEHPALGKTLSPHVMRHTYASLLLRKGVDLRTLQELLGHSSIVTTQRYLHPTRDDLRDKIRGLD